MTALKKRHGMIRRDASPRPGSRAECSLGVLTKHFLDFVSSSQDGLVDLNAVAAKFNVQKRRIYDITNVLEGIGLIDKISKNNIRWKGGPREEDAAHEEAVAQKNAQTDKQIEVLQSHQQELDAMIATIRSCIQALTEESANQEHLYVTESDITSLECFRQHTILAVKAPQGSTLEVTDPCETLPETGKLTYRMVLKSVAGPVDVWLVNTALSDDTQPVATPIDERPAVPHQSPGNKHMRSSYDDLLLDGCMDPGPAAKRPASMSQLPAYLPYSRQGPSNLGGLASPMLDDAFPNETRPSPLSYRRASHGCMPQPQPPRADQVDGHYDPRASWHMFESFPEGDSEQQLQQLRDFLDLPSTNSFQGLNSSMCESQSLRGRSS